MANAIAAPHSAIYNLVQAHKTYFGIGPEDRLAQLARLSFDLSIQEILVSLASGASLCIPPRPVYGPELVQFLAEQSVTTVMAPRGDLAGLARGEASLAP